jgi:xanthine dehydrogenase accessory factor
VSRLAQIAAAWLAEGRAAVLVTVIEARGSAPRDAGTRMLVSDRGDDGSNGSSNSSSGCAGTIGGGHLELKAIAQAREMLASWRTSQRHVDGAPPTPPPLQTAHYPLGPALGQCCGGAVTLGFSLLDHAAVQDWPPAAPRFHLQLYGAGHVGRAIAHALLPLDVLVDWIDEREAEFPPHLGGAGEPWPAHIRKLNVDAVDAEVRHAPAGAFYLVLTHEHDLDLRITEAILRRGDFGFLGLIGSKTKQQRFVHRFEQRGIAPAALARLTCPIGLPGITGKEPEVIAAAVVAQLLSVRAATG